MPHDFQDDIDAVNRIDAVTTILDVVCRTTGMGFAAVARVTDERWIACQVLDKIAFGLVPGGELEVATTICDEIRQSGEAVIIDHVAEDEVFCGHHTPAMYGFQSYISMPIIRQDGSFFGTLCAIDPKPARLKNPETIGMFRLFAELIASQLDANDRISAIEGRLEDERKISELRDQFIAVLGHDLRNPLASVGAGVRMLARAPLDEKSRNIVTLVQSSLLRMNGLIDNILDFARGRLGEGIVLEVSENQSLEAALRQVIDELKSVSPDRVIKEQLRIDDPVQADAGRIAQLVSNLLGNALTHGAVDAPVGVEAMTRDGVFEISITNAGDPIPAAEMDGLFEPFSRGKVRPNQQGLGLGLYIASEIARAHRGTLSAESNSERTRFTFRMPAG
ncbi:MAG TPA: GAF domain-containing sensor histidine kinase [Devosiaceae bacterium]|jgi:signal transduction histidine kinase